MGLLEETLTSIKPQYESTVKSAENYIDNLSKPIGSLGKLEKIVSKISGITGKVKNSISKKNIIIMCADNGVVEEGISNNPQSTTAVVAGNFTYGITGVCKLAEFEKSDITVVDVGINGTLHNKDIINRKIAYGTKNMAKGPAMTRKEAESAVEVGIEIVGMLASKRYDLLGTGEMGVGNTTTSAAVLSALSGIDPSALVGKGSGLTEKQFENKKSVVKRCIEVNKPDKYDVLDVLSKVGGFDIAGLCGCYIGASRYRIPIVIDGFISSVAALCAYRLNPLSKDYMFPSHMSKEPGMEYVMKEIGLEPMLDLDMRLGEGSGCPLAFNIIEAALYTMNNMGTFDDAKLTKDDYIDIR